MNNERYNTVYDPKHPLARSKGFVFEHRKVLYDRLGPGIHPCNWCEDWVEWGVDLCVDHLDGNGHNNDPSNLVPSCRACNVRRMYPRCSCEFCGEPCYARGLCPAHYQQRRSGKPLTALRSRPASVRDGCAVEACRGRHWARGLCKTHYGPMNYRERKAKREALVQVSA